MPFALRWGLLPFHPPTQSFQFKRDDPKTLGSKSLMADATARAQAAGTRTEPPTSDHDAARQAILRFASAAAGGGGGGGGSGSDDTFTFEYPDQDVMADVYNLHMCVFVRLLRVCVRPARVRVSMTACPTCWCCRHHVQT